MSPVCQIQSIKTARIGQEAANFEIWVLFWYYIFKTFPVSENISNYLLKFVCAFSTEI